MARAGLTLLADGVHTKYAPVQMAFEVLDGLAPLARP